MMAFKRGWLLVVFLSGLLSVAAMVQDPSVYDQHGPLRVVTSDGKKHKLSLDELKSLESAMLHSMASVRLTQAAQLDIDPHVLADDPTANPYLTARALKLLRKLAQNKTRTAEMLAKRKFGILAELAVAAENLQIDWLKPAAYEGFAKRMIKVSDKTFSDLAWVLEHIIAGSSEEEHVKAQLSFPIVELNLTAEDINSIAWSPSGSHLVVVYQGKKIVFWNVCSNELDGAISLPFAKELRVEWSPQGDYLLIFLLTDDDTTAFALCKTTGKLKQKISESLHWELPPFCEYDAKWSPNGAYLAVYSERGLIHVYDVKTAQLICILECGEGRPCAIEWSFDGKFLAYSSKKGILGENLYVYNIEMKRLNFVLSRKSEPAWSADGKRLFVVDEKRHDVLECYEGCSGELYKSYPIGKMNYTLNKKYLATHCGASCAVDIIDCDTGKLKHQCIFKAGKVEEAIFSPDDTMLVVMCCDEYYKNEAVSVIDVATGMPKASFSIKRDLRRVSCTWSADSRHLAIYSSVQIAVWSLATDCEHFFIFDVPSEISNLDSLKWLSESRYLMLIADKSVYFYDSCTQKIKRLDCGSYSPIFGNSGFLLSPDDRRFVAARAYADAPLGLCYNKITVSLSELISELRVCKKWR